MSKRRVHSNLVGGPSSPFPAGVEAGHYVFVSLQLPVDEHGRTVPGPPAAQAARALENVRLHLQSVGLPLSAVVALTVYVRDLGDLDAIDAELATSFSGIRPTRSAVAVADLAAGAAVALEAVAARY